MLREAGWLVRDAGEEFGTEYLKIPRLYQGVVWRVQCREACLCQITERLVQRPLRCYLAAGLPVILQDTGYSDWLPTGRGVLAFSTLEEAASCLDRVAADYPVHRRAARKLPRHCSLTIAC